MQRTVLFTALAMLAFGPWALGKLAAFSTRLWTAIPAMF